MYPAPYANKIFYDAPRVSRVLVFDEYSQQNYEMFDLAVVIFDRPFGLFTGWFGCAMVSNEILQLQKINLAGYSNLCEKDS